MSMLIEKRQEFADRLSKLLIERENNIAAKIAAYHAKLEAEPLSEDIVNTQKCIKALDDVIAYESMTSDKANEVVKEDFSVKETEAKTDEVNTKDVETKAIEIRVSTNEMSETATVDANGNISIAQKDEVENARPGMAYIGIPERR